MDYRLVRDGSRPFVAFGEQQKSAKFTRKWHLFPPQETGKLFPMRSNVEFYYSTQDNIGRIEISDAGMALLGNRFAALVLSDGLSSVYNETDASEPVPTHNVA